MSIAVEQTIHALQELVQAVPVGTHLALLHFLWALLNGAFLLSRGAIFPALTLCGFTPAEVRRSWAAMRYGVWSINELIQAWQRHVLADGHWQAREYEGYTPVAADLTAFFRPRLKGWPGKFCHRLAGRALRGVGFGLVGQIGQVGEQRITLLRRIIRAPEDDMREATLKAEVLAYLAEHLASNEVAVLDAGFELAEVHAAGVKRYVVRLALNATARRNYRPDYKGQGRKPQYGVKVRPLARKYGARPIAASPPDFEARFDFHGRRIQVHGWREVITSDLKVDEANPTFHILVFFDPLYTEPLVLATSWDLQPESVLRLYLDRWPIEQVPQAAKQMLGLQRQFVFARASCHRLPELALLAGAVLTYLAAVLPPVPTGFWDRRPTATPGRLRRVLAQADFPKDAPLLAPIRKKASVTGHLPKGIAAHRRVQPV
jgi:hypothetical protein